MIKKSKLITHSPNLKFLNTYYSIFNSHCSRSVIFYLFSLRESF